MGKVIEINDETRKKLQQKKINNDEDENITVIKMTAFDNENNPHEIKVGIEKVGNLINYPLEEMPEIIEKLKGFGLRLEKHY